MTEAERLTNLETMLMHLQHDFEQLNTVVLNQQRELSQLKRDLGKLQSLTEQEPHRPFDPGLEKPPHY